jgi:two-component system, probable response regulator PhcQ
VSTFALANVLFVDDDPSLRNALSRSLRNESFRQIWADNAESACKALSQEAIDVVVADDRMPGLSGAELLAAIAKQDPKIVTILFSGQPTIGSLALAINSGRIYHLLLKPSHTDAIITVVHEAIVRKREVDRISRIRDVARRMASRLLNIEEESLGSESKWMELVEMKLK